MDLPIAVAVLVGGLVLSALFSGTETALTGLPLSRIEALSSSGGRLSKRAWLRWRNRPQHVLVTILVGNNFVNIGISAVATHLTTKLVGDGGIGLAVGVMTLAVLVFGEVTPKTLARVSPEALGRKVILFVAALDWLLAPLTGPLLGLSGLLARWRRLPLDAVPTASSVEDLRFMLSVSLREGHVSEQQHRMLEAVLRFENAVVRQVQVPRTDVAFLADTLTFEAVRDKILRLGYSRYPVYHDRDDNVIGVLLAKDLLRSEARNVAWTELLLPAHYVPEGKRVVELLREMRDKATHIALSVDEHGSIAGIVTMEDILEMIVGDIQDEFDRPEPAWRSVGEASWIVKGGLPLERLEQLTGRRFQAEPDFTSVAGLLLEEAGRVPKAGERFRVNGLLFEVMEASSRRITRVRVTVSESEEPPRE